jgi:hypothetical protein
MSVALIKAVNEALGGDVDYLPYNINDTTVTVGTPPVPMSGLSYVLAAYRTTQNRLIMSLTGSGIFCGNRNNSGVIEIGLMADCASVGAISAMALTGIPLPIFSTDSKTTGTSFVAAGACKPIKTPDWRRDLAPGVTIFTFHTPRLIISHGVRKTQ